MSLLGGRFHHHRRTAPGAPPGEFVSATEELPTRGTRMSFDRSGCDERALTFPLDAAQLERPAGRVTWIDLSGLGDHDALQMTGDAFGLHTLAVADLANARQRPKAEFESELFVLFARMVRPATDEELEADPDVGWVWEQIGIVRVEDGVLTVQERYGDCLDPLRERIRQLRERLGTLGAGYLAVQILDAVVDGYYPVVESCGERLQELEDQVLERPQGVLLADVYAIRRELIHLRRASLPLREALTALDRQGKAALSERVQPYLRDVLDHLIQLVDLADTYRELTNTLIDVHLSSVANRTNEVMRVLAIVSTTFIPLSFLAGVFGMNFDRSQPGNMPELGWAYGYLIFWAVCVAVVGLQVWMFRRRGWIGRSS